MRRWKKIAFHSYVIQSNLSPSRLGNSDGKFSFSPSLPLYFHFHGKAKTIEINTDREGERKTNRKL